MQYFREYERKPLLLPVRLESGGPAGAFRGHEAVSRDVSAKGIYLRTRNRKMPGAEVTIEIILPSDYGLRFQGRVVRAEDHGMAIQFSGAAPWLMDILFH